MLATRIAQAGYRNARRAASTAIGWQVRTGPAAGGIDGGPSVKRSDDGDERTYSWRARGVWKYGSG